MYPRSMDYQRIHYTNVILMRPIEWRVYNHENPKSNEFKHFIQSYIQKLYK